MEPLSKRRKNIPDKEVAIEALLSFITVKQTPSSIGPLRVVGGWKRFVCPEPILPDFIEDYGVPSFKIGEDVYDDLATPLNISILEPPSEKTEGQFEVRSFRSVNPSTVRGKLLWFSPKIVSCAYLFHRGSKRAESAEFLVARKPGSLRWSVVDSRMNDDARAKEEEDRMTERIGLVSQMHFFKEMQWRASLWEDESLGLSFQINPSQAQDLFRLRDVPEGRQRRTMIRNWVESHWRRKAHCEDDWIEVIKHLRGGTKFRWRGLNVHFMPSHDALVEAQKIKEAKWGAERPPEAQA